MKLHIKILTAVISLAVISLPHAALSKEEDSGEKKVTAINLEDFRDLVTDTQEVCQTNPYSPTCEAYKIDLDATLNSEAYLEELGFDGGWGEKDNPKAASEALAQSRELYTQTFPRTADIHALIQAPRINLEQGYASIGTLHERRGENAVLRQADRQLWGRILGNYVAQSNDERGRFKLRDYGFQVGYDHVHYSQHGNHQLTGVLAGIRTGQARLYAQPMSFEQLSSLLDNEFGGFEFPSETYAQLYPQGQTPLYQGRQRLTQAHLGFEHTRYAKQGDYVDTVGLITYTHNQYEPLLEGKRSSHAFGALLSVEVGKRFLQKQTSEQAHTSVWLAEPQAQLIYQFLASKHQSQHIKLLNTHGLRGRIGIRLAYHHDQNEDVQARSVYAIANVWKDFNTTPMVQIAQTPFTQRYHNTWWEAGLGAQLPLSRDLSIYTDVRYEQAFGSRKDRQGYRGTLGLKYHLQ